MIIANFTCPKCRAVLDLENVEEGQLVDCPQCKATFEIPKTKRTAPVPPRMPASQQKPPSHWGYVILAMLGGFTLFGAVLAGLTVGIYAFAAGIAASIWFFVAGTVIQLLSDIRWHVAGN